MIFCCLSFKLAVRLFSVVVFRKANKIGFFIKVTPGVKEGDAKVRI